MQEVNIKDKAKLIITKELQAQISYLHNKVGAIEWSGVLFSKRLAGDISDPKSLVYEANYIFPMNVGSASYTEFDYSTVIMDMFEVNPEIGDYKICSAHSHHGMQAFFSGVDYQELRDNSPHHNYYVSLIVNFACQFCAKIAVHGKETGGFISYKGSNGLETRVAPEREILMLIDCDIEYEADEWLKNRLNQVFEEKKVSEAKKVKSNVNTWSNQPQYSKTLIPERPLYNNQQVVGFSDEVDEDLRKARLFLCRWLSRDNKTKLSLDTVIATISKQVTKDKYDLYLRHLENSMNDSYETIFTEEDSVYVLLTDSCDILEEYREDNPIVEEIIKLIDTFYNGY